MKDILHIGLGVLSVLVALKWADWKNWRHYYPTMVFMAAGNLLYNYITYKHPLWTMENDIFPIKTISDLFLTFVNFPITVLFFLSVFPSKGLLSLSFSTLIF